MKLLTYTTVTYSADFLLFYSRLYEHDKYEIYFKCPVFFFFFF